MIKTKTVSALVVDCSDCGFGPFEVLVVPSVCQGHDCYDFYLRHPQYDGEMYVGSIGANIEGEELAEIAYAAAIDHIPDYIEGVFNDEQD